MKLLVIFFLLPYLLLSFDKMLHLHIDDLNSFYKTVSSNKVFKQINKSSDWRNFERSKLYIRLFNDITAMDPNNKILNFDNIEKIPNGSLDLFLINIEEEKFIAKIKLEKSQSTALLNVDLENLPKTSFNKKVIYTYKKLHIIIENDFLYISNDLNNLKMYLEDSKKFESQVELKDNYKNFLFLNIKKINKTPYLKNYWFTKSKNFSDIETVEILFNLNKKSFEEAGIITFKTKTNKSTNLKKIDGKFKIKLFDRNGNFQISPFTKEKLIKIYSMASNDFESSVYLAKYTGEKSFNNFIKAINSSAILTEKDILEYKYGVMNHQTIYIKVLDKFILFSDKLELLKDIKIKDETKLNEEIVISDFNKISNKISKLSKLDKNNYSYNSFLKSYLMNYLSINYFKFKLKKLNDNKLKFKTKIIF